MTYVLLLILFKIARLQVELTPEIYFISDDKVESELCEKRYSKYRLFDRNLTKTQLNRNPVTFSTDSKDKLNFVLLDEIRAIGRSRSVFEDAHPLARIMDRKTKIDAFQKPNLERMFLSPALLSTVKGKELNRQVLNYIAKRTRFFDSVDSIDSKAKLETFAKVLPFMTQRMNADENYPVFVNKGAFEVSALELNRLASQIPSLSTKKFLSNPYIFLKKKRLGHFDSILPFSVDAELKQDRRSDPFSSIKSRTEFGKVSIVQPVDKLAKCKSLFGNSNERPPVNKRHFKIMPNGFGKKSVPKISVSSTPLDETEPLVSPLANFAKDIFKSPLGFPYVESGLAEKSPGSPGKVPQPPLIEDPMKRTSTLDASAYRESDSQDGRSKSSDKGFKLYLEEPASLGSFFLIPVTKDLSSNEPPLRRPSLKPNRNKSSAFDSVFRSKSLSRFKQKKNHRIIFRKLPYNFVGVKRFRIAKEFNKNLQRNRVGRNSFSQEDVVPDYKHLVLSHEELLKSMEIGVALRDYVARSEAKKNIDLPGQARKELAGRQRLETKR